MKLFVSWSGGKDSALAAYRALRQGHPIAYLLNCVTEEGDRTRSHGLPAEVIGLQAQAMGIPLIQVQTSWEEYEAHFKDAMQMLARMGIGGGVFGDMAIDEHREWVERVCAEVGLRPLLPLWGDDPEALLEEFWQAGFQAVVVATRLGPEFLGRWLDRALVTEMVARGAHPCGEEGEYHTLVTAGPLFRRSLSVRWDSRPKGAIHHHQGVWFLDVEVALGDQ
ncbi:MAG: diphthine--ammonia ligase [Anaerolineae bacterium]